ncbi:hypothetical protein EVA_03958 [gut metagenome]|uniref:Uncharacterized protein n=1 Tax=gut metagenome TaxID=749906 RepID=J9GJP3_9ZZZZ
MHHWEGHQENCHQHRIVSPIGRIRLSWISHIGDRTEHSSIDTDTSCPPRHTSTAFEEVFGTIFTTHKIKAKGKHTYKVNHKYHPVEPAEFRIGLHLYAGHVAGTHTRLRLTVDQHPAIVEIYQPRTGTRQERIAGSGSPSISNGVIDQNFLIELVPFRRLFHIGRGETIDGSHLSRIALNQGATTICRTVDGILEYIVIDTTEV